MTQTKDLVWHIDEQHLPQLHTELRTDLSQSPVAKLTQQLLPNVTPSNSLESSYNEYYAKFYSPDPAVLVLPIHGTMRRTEGWEYVGNDLMVRMLEEAATNKRYKGVVLQMNTPGGTADSCLALADSIANFARKKPIVTATAYCCSAGYFAASQTHEIFIEDQAASSIGSIGTLLFWQNVKGYYEKEGIQIEIMRATASADKARHNAFEELTPELRDELQQLLDACQKEFAGAVKRGRAGKINPEAMTGKTYAANAAISLGLADRKGTLTDAIKRIHELSK